MDNDFNYDEEIKKLTEKQRRFIDYYIETGNASQASKMAGYKGTNLNNLGAENLAKLGKFIDYKLKQKDKSRIASQDEVLEFLTRVKRGDEPGASMQDRIKCAELLGKRWATFTEKREVTSDGTLEVKIDKSVSKWGE